MRRPTGWRCRTSWRTAPWEGRTHRTTDPPGGLDDLNEAERGPQPAEGHDLLIVDLGHVPTGSPSGHDRTDRAGRPLGSLGRRMDGQGLGPPSPPCPAGHRATAAAQGCPLAPNHRPGGEPAGASSLWNLSAPGRAKRPRLAAPHRRRRGRGHGRASMLGCWRSTAFGGPSQHRGRIWQVASLERVSCGCGADSTGTWAGAAGRPTGDSAGIAARTSGHCPSVTGRKREGDLRLDVG
jgi:hypothetical protein